MREQGHEREEAEEDGRRAANRQLRPLPLRLDAEMSAHFLYRSLQTDTVLSCYPLPHHVFATLLMVSCQHESMGIHSGR